MIKVPTDNYKLEIQKKNSKGPYLFLCYKKVVKTFQKMTAGIKHTTLNSHRKKLYDKWQINYKTNDIVPETVK